MAIGDAARVQANPQLSALLSLHNHSSAEIVEVLTNAAERVEEAIETEPLATAPVETKKRHKRRSSLGKRDFMDAVKTTMVSADRAAAHAKTGTRKERRWASFLTMLRSVDIQEEDLQPSYPQTESVFSQVLNDPAKLQAWYQFLKSSEEKQHELLTQRSPRSSPINANSSKKASRPSAEMCYARIDRSSREVLRRSNISPEFLCHLENDVLSFLTKVGSVAASPSLAPSDDTIQVPDLPLDQLTPAAVTNTEDWLNVQVIEQASSSDDAWEVIDDSQDALDKHEPWYDWEVATSSTQIEAVISQVDELFDQTMLLWRLDDAYSRCVGHSVCQYYGLVSYSEDFENARITRVLRPAKQLLLPKESLTDYLHRSCKTTRWSQQKQQLVDRPVWVVVN